MNHRSLLAALLAIPIAALAAQAATAFRDLPPGHWARKPAGILADAKIMKGRTLVDFSGEVPLTRYELAEILSQLYNEEGPPATFVVLKDMSPGHEATQAVQRVMGYQLLAARKPGVFAGEEAVTRKEIAEALDTLLERNGVSPPARKRNPVTFSDITPGGSLAPVLDRIVNRYAIIEGKYGSPFYPNNAVTRFQMLNMLIKAMPYLNAAVDRELRDAMRPSAAPPASPLPSGASPIPETPSPSEEPTVVPFTPPPSIAPTPVPVQGGALLRNRGGGRAEVLMVYSEDLPTETGAVAIGEQRQFSGGGLPGGGVNAEYWGAHAGGRLDVHSYYIGFDVPHNGKQEPIDVLDTVAMAQGWYKAGSGANWELAFGGAGVYRKAYNLTGKLIGQYYLTTDKDYFGAGPGLMFGHRFSPDLDMIGTALVFPLVQSYQLPRGAKSLTRWGADLDVRAVYKLGGGLSLDGGIHAFLSGAFSGGSQTMIGVHAGATMEF